MTTAVQIGIFGLQILTVLTLILIFHRQRSRYGLGPVFLAVGGLEMFTMVVTALWVRVQLPNGVELLTGPSGFYTIEFTAVLLVYLCDGTLHARTLIFSLIGLQACHIVWRLLVALQMSGPGATAATDANVFQGQLFVPDLRVNLASVAAKLVTFFTFIILYQWLSNRFSGLRLSVRIFLGLLAAFAINDVLFYVLGMAGKSGFETFFVSGLIVKPFVAALVAPILALYLRRFADYLPGEDFRAPMNILQGDALLRASLAESEARYENLFENANELILITDPTNGRILDANHHACECLGYSSSELAAKTILELCPPEETDRLRMLTEPSGVEPSKNIGSVDLKFICRDDHPLTVALRTYKATSRGRDVVVFLARDITERRLAVEGLRQANLLKDEFLQNISHELRTPLSAILGWTDLLISNVLDPTQSKLGFRQIKSSAEKLLQLVNDLLDLSKVERGGFEVDIQLEDINAPVRAACDVFRFAAENKGLTFRMELESGLPLIKLDVMRVQQIVLNLVSNAVKFTESGGEVTISTRPAGPFVQVEVSDTGCGIDPRALPFIFEGFRQADGSTTRVHGGTGVGLALVKSLIDLHGGTIKVTSEVGKGSVFICNFPVCQAEDLVCELDDGPPGSPDSEEFPSLAPSPTRKILIIDDDENLLHLVGAIVRSGGYEGILAPGGAQALESVKGVVPALVLCDIGMPEMDGFQTFTELRKDARLKDVKIVALTAYSSIKDKQEILQFGFDDFLPKPFKKDQLLGIINRLAGA